MGGGNFVVPIQTVTDFMENKLSGENFVLFLGLPLLLKISSSMTCSFICSDISTTIKLSVRSQDSQSP